MNVIAITMSTLRKMPITTKQSTYRTINFVEYPAKQQREYIEEELKVKLRMYLENINWDVEEEKEIGMQLGC